MHHHHHHHQSPSSNVVLATNEAASDTASTASDDHLTTTAKKSSSSSSPPLPKTPPPKGQQQTIQQHHHKSSSSSPSMSPSASSSSIAFLRPRPIDHGENFIFGISKSRDHRLKSTRETIIIIITIIVEATITSTIIILRERMSFRGFSFGFQGYDHQSVQYHVAREIQNKSWAEAQMELKGTNLPSLMSSPVKPPSPPRQHQMQRQVA